MTYKGNLIYQYVNICQVIHFKETQDCSLKMTSERTKNLRELEAALGLLKLSGFQMNRYCTGKQMRKTRLQTCVLNRIFEISRFPSSKTIVDLALLINVHPKSIQKWFQNTRQAIRKKGSTKGALLLAESEEHSAVDIPLPILADIVEIERRAVSKFGLE
uniref:Homeobox domain containing protein n=1 Tax=Encephalitozoon cuniculi TaxID=6035 RepID=M1KK56_ENCCN|nr:homeobox domain containing protein [Encephalitozoon cuniculi]